MTLALYRSRQLQVGAWQYVPSKPLPADVKLGLAGCRREHAAGVPCPQCGLAAHVVHPSGETYALGAGDWIVVERLVDGFDVQVIDGDVFAAVFEPVMARDVQADPTKRVDAGGELVVAADVELAAAIRRRAGRAPRRKP